MTTDEYALAEDFAAAKRGDREGIRRLGRRYYYGEGVDQDRAKALAFWRRAAQLGDARAMYSVGVCYQIGEAIDANPVEAVSWYQAAAEGGYADAMYQFGVCLQDGVGAPEDTSLANDWYRRAIAAGSVAAKVRLAVNLEGGFGVPEDLGAANRLYREAAEAGDTSGMVNLALNLASGHGIARDQAAAVSWFRKATDGGNTEAMWRLGQMIEAGAGADADVSLANQLYLRAAEAGEIQGMKYLADNLRRGRGTAKDRRGAAHWYTKAAELGDAEAMHFLGVTYDLPGPDRDPHLAHHWITESAKAGHSGAMLKLAGFYEVGRRVPVDLARTIELCEAAAAKGDGCALFNVGRWQNFGVGRSADLAAAAASYEKAAKDGCSCAAASLRSLRPNPKVTLDTDAARTTPIDANSNNCSDLLRSALQAILGLGVTASNDIAASLVARYAALNLRRCTHRRLAEGLRQHVLSDRGLLERLRQAALTVNFESGAGAQSFIERARGTPTQGALLSRAISAVAGDENWPGFHEWRRTAILAEAPYLGLSADKITAANRDVGIRYNALSEAGVLIPHEYASTTWKDLDGVGEFLGVETKTRKSIIEATSLIGKADPGSPILVTTDDLFVAFSLIYSSSEPSLSLEALETHPFDPTTSFLRRKEFNPPWLAATNFGKALYFADWLMGQGAGSTVSITDPLRRPDDVSVRKTARVMSDLIFSHTPYSTDSGRMMLYLSGVNVATKLKSSLFGPTVIQKFVLDIQFRIDGSGIDYLSSGKEDRSIGLNDPDYGSSHTGLILTSRYEVLCKAFPVFARVRALLAMTRIIAKLKDDGFTLTSEKQTAVAAAVQHWQHAARTVPLIVANW